jgi:hypothetical protein
MFEFSNLAVENCSPPKGKLASRRAISSNNNRLEPVVSNELEDARKNLSLC